LQVFGKGIQRVVFPPFKVYYELAFFPHCSSYIFYGTSWENVHQNQDILFLIIISFIDITYRFDQVVIEMPFTIGAEVVKSLYCSVSTKDVRVIHCVKGSADLQLRY